MSATLQATATSIPSPGAIIRRSSLGRLVSGSTMLLLGTIGTLIIVLALLILFHHNLNATKGYRLRSLEHVRNQLLLQQEILNMEIAKAQSLAVLQADPKVQAMAKATRPKYVTSDVSIASAEEATGDEQL